jgi:hypothetical protein
MLSRLLQNGYNQTGAIVNNSLKVNTFCFCQDDKKFVANTFH